jgi:hypothetical protein
MKHPMKIDVLVSTPFLLYNTKKEEWVVPFIGDSLSMQSNEKNNRTRGNRSPMTFLILEWTIYVIANVLIAYSTSCQTCSVLNK